MRFGRSTGPVLGQGQRRLGLTHPLLDSQIRPACPCPPQQGGGVLTPLRRRARPDRPSAAHGLPWRPPRIERRGRPPAVRRRWRRRRRPLVAAISASAATALTTMKSASTWSAKPTAEANRRRAVAWSPLRARHLAQCVERLRLALDVSDVLADGQRLLGAGSGIAQPGPGPGPPRPCCPPASPRRTDSPGPGCRRGRPGRSPRPRRGGPSLSRTTPFWLASRLSSNASGRRLSSARPCSTRSRAPGRSP